MVVVVVVAVVGSKRQRGSGRRGDPLRAHGAATNPLRPWKYVTWQTMQITAKAIPSEECENPPSNVTYCWYVTNQQGMQPSPVPCEIVTECEYVTGPSIQYDTYTLNRANYTVQVAAMLPGSGLAPRCFTGFFVVPPTPRIPLYIRGGPRSFLAHGIVVIFFFVGGGRDPDKRPGSDLMKLDIKWECHTDDLEAKKYCNGSMDNNSNMVFQKVTILEDEERLSDYKSYAMGYFTMSYFRHGFSYNLTVKAKELEWPYRTAETSLQERRLLNTGTTPPILITCSRPCELERLTPTEEVTFEILCYYNCLPGVDIMYEWAVFQNDKDSPVDLTVSSKEGKSRGVNMDKLTILPGTFRKGAKVIVQVKANYFPSNPKQINVYNDENSFYEYYQLTNR
ncbi:hypothetical protein E2C01_064667 [Portunus trituberculatus]|uniref:PKD/REJ-like domain-containing protein n=1 Tax=Portunus trituberculatus TaxID=210409 RepID=A0A5B7HNZ8_PORTR|nr:hypothetical protein [Portunus trituberculatus]